MWMMSAEGYMKRAKELIGLIRHFSEAAEGCPFVVRFEIAKDKAEDKTL
jgi:hypothetical protein